MNHSDFIAAYRSGKIKVSINKNAAGTLLEKSPNAPTAYKAATHFWKSVGCLTLIAGIILFFIISWYWALGILILGVVVCTASQSGDIDNVSILALENEAFYNDCISSGVMTISVIE